jgi:formylglycine-generating enzyme required for sulfatase activity
MKAILLLLTLIISAQICYSRDETTKKNKQQGNRFEENTADSAKLPEMILIQGGTFQMGSNEEDRDQRPAHAVTVKSFYMAKYEVTVAQFGQFISETGYLTDADNWGGSFVWTGSLWETLDGVNWKCNAEGNLRPDTESNHPVIHVSWNDAREYCKWLSKKTGKEYRLPTEAEWEYAAGNGSKHTTYSWGNGEPAGKNGGNVADESTLEIFGSLWPGYNDGFVYTAAVGRFNPNELGLYDMTGNVGEWCSDFYDSKYYKSSLTNNPKGPSNGTYRVIRGGSYRLEPTFQRVVYRDRGDPFYRYFGTGFRVVMAE